MKQELVRYHNELNQVNLGRLSSIEMSIFFALCKEFAKRPDDTTMTMTFREIKKIISYKTGGKARFLADIRRLYTNYLGLHFVTEDEHKVTGFNLFPKFVIDKDLETVTLTIAEDMRYLLQNLASNFTQFEWDAFIGLSSSYAKALFLHLKQFRTTGYFVIRFSDFKKIMDIPEKYTTSDINKRVLDPAMKELAPYFKDLTLEKIKANTRGKPVEKLVFRFSKELLPAQEVKRTGQICPYCGEVLIERTLNGSNCWCHEDGWLPNAKCKAVFNAVSDIERQHEIIKRQQEELTPKTQEQEENIRRLQDITKSMFSSVTEDDMKGDDEDPLLGQLKLL